jgi:hypothetical protein
VIVAGLFALALSPSVTDGGPSLVTGARSSPLPVGPASNTAEPRTVYPYSVIPGGVHSRDELRDALREDAVAASHHAAVALRDIRAERVTTPRRAYVSYRVGDRIYWTRHMVPLVPGETLLTDGRTTIRARCGNAVSDRPMIPTWVGEPDAAVFDIASATNWVETVQHVSQPVPDVVEPVEPPIVFPEPTPDVFPEPTPGPPRRQRPPRSVPEPGTVLLLGGAAVAGWLRRQQRPAPFKV